MATLTFDTYDFIQRLEISGIEEKQAKAIADGLREIDLDNVSTKGDIAEVKAEIKNLEIRLLKWLIPLFLFQYAFLIGLIFSVLSLMSR